MAAHNDELEQLRGALESAKRQAELDRATIEALGNEIRDQRREAQHQVRNILSVVRSIARRTAEEGETGENYQARLESRLASFTRLQNAILSNPPGGVDLCSLIADELLAFHIGLGDQAHLDGDPLCLKPRPASVLGLAFHELARMAIEDGASGSLDGRINVSWKLDADGEKPSRLRIAWTETGRLAGASRRASSFGRDILEQAIAYELAGSVMLGVTADGLDCRFDLPTDRLAQKSAPATVEQ